MRKAKRIKFHQKLIDQRRQQIVKLEKRIAALENKIQDGKNYVITNGAYDIDDIVNVIVSRIEIAPIVKPFRKEADSVTLYAPFDNREVTETYQFREIGVFALDPESKQEVLYSYTNCGEEAEKIEGVNLNFVEKTLKIIVTVNDAENVTITVNPNLNYITRSEEQDLRNEDKKQTEALLKSILAMNTYGCDSDLFIGDDFVVPSYRITDNIKHLVSGQFENNQKIKVVCMPNGVRRLAYENDGGNTFANCQNLEKVYFPDTLELIERYSFANCSRLDNVMLNNMASIGINKGAFEDCTSLKNIDLSSVEGWICEAAFRNCESLPCIKFLNITAISKQAFSGCTNLRKVDLGSVDDVVDLESIDVFENTPIANGDGFIYVIDKFIDNYKSSTNWCVYAEQIKPISELEETL